MSDHSNVTGGLLAFRRVQWMVLLILLASFAVRSHRLEAKSLWTDEGLTFRRAEQPIGVIFKNQNLIPVGPNYYDGTEMEVFVTPDVHPPLYFLFMHFWIRVAGSTEFALRFPSVMASTLALPLFFVLGTTLLSRETGLWAVLLAALSPFYTWHAQEARMYAWVILFSLASVYTFLPLLRNKSKPRHYVAYLVATSALLYTHYTGFLLLAFEVIIYAVYQSRRRIGPVLIVLAILALILVPLVPYARRVLDLSLVGYVSRPLPTLLAEAWSYFSLGISESLIRPLSQTAPFLALFAVGMLMLGTPNRQRAWMVSLGYLLFPMLMFHAISYFKPNYMNPRHLLVMSPAWELIMAQGLSTLRRRFWPGLVILISLSLFLRGTAIHNIFTSHHMWKDDIRGAAAYIEARARPGDAIILHDPVIRLTFDYYYDGPYPEIAIPSYGQNNQEDALSAFAAWAQRYDRVWFLYGPPPANFPNDLLPDWADNHLFKVRQREFEAIWTYVGVAAYDDESPVLSAPPPRPDSRDVAWGPLRLISFQGQEIVRGATSWLQFYWEAEEEAPREAPRLKVQLLDDKGTVWFEREEDLLPFYPPSAWPADSTVQTEFRLPLPDDTPPITYTVEAAVMGLGEPQRVGKVSVAPEEGSPTALRAKARFQNGMDLLSSQLGSDVFRAGNALFGSLTWRLTAPIDEDYRVRVRLTKLWGREMAVNEMPPSAAGFPTSAWSAGDQVAGRLILPLPADLKDGWYRVEISLVDKSTGRTSAARHWYGKSTWLSLGTVKVQAWPLVTTVPDDIEQHPEDVEIAGNIRLRGYNLARMDERIRLTLYWQAQGSLEQNYHVFVHVGKPDQPPVANAGGVPVDWTRPTTSWRQGEIIVDEYVLSLSDVPPDHYGLLVGFYDPETGERPRTVVNGDLIQGGYVTLDEVDLE